MTDRTKAFELSVAFHLAIAVAILVVGGALRRPAVPRVIDVTLLPAPGSAPSSVDAPLEGPAAAPLPLPQAEPAPETPPMPPVDAPAEAQPEPKPPETPAAPVPPAPPATPPAAPAPPGVPFNAIPRGGSPACFHAQYFADIRDSIQRRLGYPPAARTTGWQGRVVVAFTLRRDGSVGDVKIVRSSGLPILDSNAVDAVKRSAPFPPPPVDVEFVTPFVYRLD